MRSAAAPLALLLAVAAVPRPAFAEPTVSLTGLAGLFARFPMSMAEPGGALAVSRSLWFGDAHRFLQLRADVQGLAGVGRTPTFFGAAALTGGADLYLLPWLSLDVRVGPGAGVQLGRTGHTPLVGLWGSGGWSLHPWDDPHRRVTLAMNMSTLVPTRPDPGNDCLCVGLLGIGLGYETPLR